MLTLCLLVAIVCFGAWPVLTGQASPIWDAGTYFGPHFSLVADYARHGRLELWNPWINAGTPDFAEPQLGTASPILLIFALVSPNPFSGFIAYWIAMWLFGAAGMLLLCRHLGAPSWGAAVIALGFAACGVYTGNAEHISFLYSFSFLPWTIWRFDRALIDRRLRHMIEAALVWGLSAQGGYPGVTITTVLFLALWGAGRIWIDRDVSHGARPDRAIPRAGRLALALTILLGVGFAVMSPSYVGFLTESHGYTYRGDGLDRQYSIGSNALPPAAFATLASPAIYLLKQPDRRSIWPETDLSMTNVYTGALTIVLALTALWRPSRWRIWIAAVAAFCGCCAVGPHLPLRGWLYDLLPPTRYFRFSSLFRLYVIVSAGVLAAYGSRDLDVSWRAPGSERYRRRVFGAAAGVAMVALAVDVLTLHAVQQSIADAPYALMHVLLVWSSATAMLFLAWRSRVSPKTCAAALVALAAYDAASTLEISRSTMSDGAALPAWNAMQTQHSSSLNVTAGGWTRTFFPPAAVEDTRNNRNVALKTATFDSRVPLKNVFFTKYLDDPLLNRTALGTDRIWFSDRPVWLAPTDANFDAFARASHALGSPMLILHRPNDMPKPPAELSREPVADLASLEASPALAPAHVDLVVYEPATLEFRYRADRDGWLLVTDRWSVSWRASVNGRDEPVLGGNFVFRAVAVTRGDNDIRFLYDPRGYFFWVGLSWMTVAIGVAWLSWRK